ncbi:hypothetical protein ABIC71_004431 [Herbaspirillum seropedicae]|uniref:hypothetical protein n=1 Tax=Herbaspirillum seropedicae TaxID=964 RepID=UPI0033977478
MNGYLSISGMIWNTFSNSRATGDYLQQTERGRYYQGTRGEISLGKDEVVSAAVHALEQRRKSAF